MVAMGGLDDAAPAAEDDRRSPAGTQAVGERSTPTDGRWFTTIYDEVEIEKRSRRMVAMGGLEPPTSAL